MRVRHQSRHAPVELVLDLCAQTSAEQERQTRVDDRGIVVRLNSKEHIRGWHVVAGRRDVELEPEGIDRAGQDSTGLVPLDGKLVHASPGWVVSQAIVSCECLPAAELCTRTDEEIRGRRRFCESALEAEQVRRKRRRSRRATRSMSRAPPRRSARAVGAERADE